MLKLRFSKKFISELNSLPKEIQNEASEKIEIFQKNPRTPLLRCHKLHGSLQDYFAFSVNHRIRIVFEYMEKNIVLLTNIGDHDIYR